MSTDSEIFEACPYCLGEVRHAPPDGINYCAGDGNCGCIEGVELAWVDEDGQQCDGG